MRKLSDLYNELRQVHRRLEVDLRGVRDSKDYDHDIPRHSEMEIKTAGRSVNMRHEESREERVIVHGEEEEMGRSHQASRKLSRMGSIEMAVDRKDQHEQVTPSRTATAGSSGVQPNVFSLAPNRGSRTSFEGRRRNAREDGRHRRHDEQEYGEDNEEEEYNARNEVRLTTRLSRHTRY